jgi:hypothetical protein
MPWLKIYTRKLDDARFAKIAPAHLGRWLQLMLLSGKLDAGGCFIENGCQLTMDEIAWKLRCDKAELVKDFEALQSAGLIILNGHGPELSNFMEEQGPSNKEQRKAWKRRQGKHRTLVATVTQVQQRVTRDNQILMSDNSPVTLSEKSQSQSQSQSQRKSQTSESEKRATRTKRAQPGKSDPAGNGLTADDGTDTILEQGIAKLKPEQKDCARQVYKIYGSSGLGNPKLLEISVYVATRINQAKAVEMCLAALASSYGNRKANNKPVIAAANMMSGKISPECFEPKAWEILPKVILEAAGITNLNHLVLERLGITVND